MRVFLSSDQSLSDCEDDSAEGAALNQVTQSISRFGQLGSKCHATFSIVEAMVRSVKTAEARAEAGLPARPEPLPSSGAADARNLDLVAEPTDAQNLLSLAD